ncbi:MAG TPA: septal ring lytic transglycosylase RlpA family protein [Steroidobacteraceae bacterium]|nr:septal ring lytic transglycosylase RlpA family protein [Steroidobacteraceae bacterium]
MRAARALGVSYRLLGLSAAAFALAGCLTARAPVSNEGAAPAPPATASPAAAAPDTAPHSEPRSRRGNPPFYDVFGKRYYVLSSSSAYVERGVASWYGPGFHKVQTSTGEPYDMYAMTAAHKTLPLPAYVRVTNLQNGRSVVVRVNDRGPFVGNRIIDLSYTAASRLDMLRNGTAMVEVRALDAPAAAPDPGMTLSSAAAASPAGGRTGPAASAAAASGAAASGAAASAAAASTAAAPAAAGASAGPPAAAAMTPLFVQAGAFADPANAERLAAKLRGGGYGKIFVRDDLIAGRKMYRVRIGPVPDVPEFDRIVAALERARVHDAHLAFE